MQRKVFYLIISIILFAHSPAQATFIPITVEESDGAPSGKNVRIIKFAGATVTDNTLTQGSVTVSVDSSTTSYATKTGDYTLVSADSIIGADASSAPLTITLPTAVGITGKHYTIKRINTGANTVTIATSGAETIDDGDSTLILTLPQTSVTLVSDGSGWINT